jgi:hypothetical protein
LLDGQEGSYYQPVSTALTTSTNFGGDVSGSYNAIVIADDSHNHTISNVDGLQTALDTKAPLASPALTGTPTAPTAAADTSTTQIATTAFVQQELAELVDSAPSTLDTLNEIAAAINDDPNFNTTVTTSLSNRLRIDTNSQNLTSTQKNNAIANLGIGIANTSLNGFMSAVDKQKLDGIETGATADQSDSEIKTAYENNSNTNALTDALLSKLNAIEASATADQTASEIRTLVESATDSNVFTDADHTKLNGIEANATADQTASELLTAIKTVDGPFSGLNADFVRGRTDTYLLDYNNFTNTPTIPTATSDLSNDSGFISSTLSSNLDLDGNELILDADADTSISSSTDDTIIFKVNGQNELELNDTELTPVTNNGLTLGHNLKRFLNIYTNFLNVNNLTIGTTGLVNNLNADRLDNFEGSYYLDYNNFTNTPTSSTPNNATITLAAGTGLSGGGNFTTNQSSNETITFNLNGTIPTATSDLTNDSGFISSTLSGNLDLNGNELILDADGDTSITADTDDQIDFKINGTDELELTSTFLRPSSNGGLNLGSSSQRFATTYTTYLQVGSTQFVQFLNADYLDGNHGTYYLNYNNLSNTPTIPTATSDLTNDSGFITSVPAQSFSSLTGKPTTISGYGITDAFDGAYSSLTGTPTIPSNTSDLTNDSGFITSADGGNAQTLDSLDSTQFLRSDQSDTITGDLTLTSTDGGATADPILELYRNSASPADDDILGEIHFTGNDSASNKTIYTNIEARAGSDDNGNERGQLYFDVMQNGSLANFMNLGFNVIQMNRNLQLTQNINLKFEGATSNANETTLTVTDPTADRTIELPDASGTVLLNESGILNLTNSGSQSEVRLYCESANAHYAALKAPAHADFSGNVDLTLPATTSTLLSTASNLADLADVSSTAPSSGEVLKWDGSAWSPAADATGSGGGNADTVDNKHIAVVSSLPASPDSNTIYFIT